MTEFHSDLMGERVKVFSERSNNQGFIGVIRAIYVDKDDNVTFLLAGENATGFCDTPAVYCALEKA